MGSIVVREADCSCVNFNVAARPPTANDFQGHQKSSARTSSIHRHSACIELLQHLLDFSIFHLDGRQRILDPRETLLLIRFIGCARHVFHLPIMLDLLAAILHLRKTESRGGAF